MTAPRIETKDTWLVRLRWRFGSLDPAAPETELDLTSGGLEASSGSGEPGSKAGPPPPMMGSLGSDEPRRKPGRKERSALSDDAGCSSTSSSTGWRTRRMFPCPALVVWVF